MQNFECKSCSKEPTSTVNVARFIQKLDSELSKGDLDAAVRTVEFWETEARAVHDNRGLMTVLNEQLGLFRRLGDRERALRAVDESLALVESGNAPKGASLATVLTNLATTLSAFGEHTRALDIYSRAGAVYASLAWQDRYEYAALMNNKSSALSSLGRFDEALLSLESAIRILDKEGRHDADIALSCLGIAEIKKYLGEDAEDYLDAAWEYINSERNIRDGAYAFALQKCAPFYRSFGRDIEADALEAVASEIYGR